MGYFVFYSSEAGIKLGTGGLMRRIRRFFLFLLN